MSASSWFKISVTHIKLVCIFVTMFSMCVVIKQSNGQFICGFVKCDCFSGVVGGQHFAHPGGGSNYLCLTTEPVWGRQVNEAGDMATIYGAEYQVENNNVFAPRDVHDDNVPCAVCLATSRSAQIMLPGRNHCYPGWRREYWGYLMTEHHHHNGRTEYICVHVEADRTSAGFRNEDGALLYPVASRCGSLPCPPYFNHGELTCAVCTKA